MSSNGATSLVPVLDRSNYGVWFSAMKAYLMSLGLWPVISGDVSEPIAPAIPDKDADQDEKTHYEAEARYFSIKHKAWSKDNSITLGHIVLRVNQMIQLDLSKRETTEKA